MKRFVLELLFIGLFISILFLTGYMLTRYLMYLI